MRALKFFFLVLFGVVFLITLLKVFFFLAFIGLIMGAAFLFSRVFMRQRRYRYFRPAFQGQYEAIIPLDPRYNRPFGPVASDFGTSRGQQIQVM